MELTSDTAPDFAVAVECTFPPERLYNQSDASPPGPRIVRWQEVEDERQSKANDVFMEWLDRAREPDRQVDFAMTVEVVPRVFFRKPSSINPTVWSADTLLPTLLVLHRLGRGPLIQFPDATKLITSYLTFTPLTWGSWFRGTPVEGTTQVTIEPSGHEGPPEALRWRIMVQFHPTTPLPPGQYLRVSAPFLSRMDFGEIRRRTSRGGWNSYRDVLGGPGVNVWHAISGCEARWLEIWK